MNIALIAHNSKKELMVQFCIAYSGILSQHTSRPSGKPGKVVPGPPGQRVFGFFFGDQGGASKLLPEIPCMRIALLFFFRTPIQFKTGRDTA